MSDDIIGPIIGTAVGLGLLAATVHITKDAFDKVREKEQMRPHPIKEKYDPTPRPVEPRREGEGFNIDARINKMLGR
jgi:hypothetical protein